jgi:hypothetical protein
MLPYGDSFACQLIDLRTMACLRPLTLAQAEAIASELVPVVEVSEGGARYTFP